VGVCACVCVCVCVCVSVCARARVCAHTPSFEVCAAQSSGAWLCSMILSRGAKKGLSDLANQASKHQAFTYLLIYHIYILIKINILKQSFYSFAC